MTRAPARRQVRSVAAAAALVTAVTAASAFTGTAAGGSQDSITEFAIAQTDALPTAIATSPDGTVWVAQGDGVLVALRPDPSNPQRARSSLALIPHTGSLPRALTPGPDGAMWFTEQLGNGIGRITTAGTIIEYALPTPASGPVGITTGPDGALWFTEQLGNNIGRITTAGTITEYALPTPASGPVGITTGPDGALWFTEQYGNNIGRITTAGTITEYALPTPASGPVGITTGPDGALWFTEQYGNNIGRITTDTAPTITEIDVPSRAGFPESIAPGPDGALWFTERENRQLGRIVPGASPRVTEFALHADASGPTALTSSCDGRLWFAQQGGEVGAFDEIAPNTCRPASAAAFLGDATGSSVSVLGVSRLSAAQLADWFRSTHRSARLAAGIDIDELARIFVEEAAAVGVRADLAFAQSVLETGSFSFPAGGQLSPADNNFAGLGACDSCARGRTFPTARDGVRAQMQHLRNYADPTSKAGDLGFAPSPWWYGLDPTVAARHFDTFFAKGSAPTWLDMGAGNWATDPHYSAKVLKIYEHMLEFTAAR